jgi:ATP-dependent DNA ligase
MCPGMLLRAASYGFIRPCLPSSAEHPPNGTDWIHEIKHDGYRLMVRRDGAGVRLLTRNGYGTDRFPLIRAAATALRLMSVHESRQVSRLCKAPNLAVREAE